MNDEVMILKSMNQSLGSHIAILNEKLDIAIVGLEAIISEGSDNLKIAEKTIQEIKNYKEDSQ
mgnify:CR=1 FL=1